MLSAIEKKKKIYIIAALVLLVLTRWMFFRLEIDADLEPWCFAAEAACIILIYILSLFAVPKFIFYVLMLVCGIALGIVGAVSESCSHSALLLPSVYCPVWLFFASQVSPQEKKKSAKYSVIDTVLMSICPLLLVAAIIYRLATVGFSLQANSVITVIVFILLALIYAFIMRSGAQGHSHRGKKGSAGAKSGTKTAFIFAIASIALSAVCVCLYNYEGLRHTAVIVWLLNLLFLFQAEHVPVQKAVRTFQSKLAAFFK